MGGVKPDMAMSDPGGCGLGSFGHSTRRYCTVAGHYGSPQPVAHTEICVKACLLLFKAMIWSKYLRGKVFFRYLQ